AYPQCTYILCSYALTVHTLGAPTYSAVMLLQCIPSVPLHTLQLCSYSACPQRPYILCSYALTVHAL
ncbi:hypothetical protein NDU88_007485, partial [Pleurodeles waltl]